METQIVNQLKMTSWLAIVKLINVTSKTVPSSVKVWFRRVHGLHVLTSSWWGDGCCLPLDLGQDTSQLLMWMSMNAFVIREGWHAPLTSDWCCQASERTSLYKLKVSSHWLTEVVVLKNVQTLGRLFSSLPTVRLLPEWIWLLLEMWKYLWSELFTTLFVSF